MIFPKSIRWRLQIWYGLLLVAVLCGFGITAFQWERSRQLQKLAESLRTRTAVLLKALKASPLKGSDLKAGSGLPLTAEQAGLFTEDSGFYYVIWINDAQLLAASAHAPPNIPRPAPGESLTRLRGNYREEILFAAPVNCLLVGKSIGAERAELSRTAMGLLAVGATILAVALVVGGRFVSLALQPVQEISDAAAKISAGDLEQRIPDQASDREVNQLVNVLNSTFSRLEAAFARQTQFTADAAHELRTPLAVILTQTQSALLRERTASEYRDTLEAVQRAGQRMRRLSESLLDLARLDTTQEPATSLECDLSKIAAECLELMKPLAEARGIQLHLKSEDCKVSGDPNLLAQALTALLSNAIEYNRQNGRIDVSTGREARGARVAVADTGCGIAESDLPHVFERFYRVDKSREGKTGHSGLGLAIAAAIIQSHGGSIGVSSRIQVGSTFTILFPTPPQPTPQSVC
jgi:two-component system OmpR family sensor kinase